MIYLFLVLSFICNIYCGTNSKGLEFLAENKLKEGVVTTASGLQYKILKKGDGRFHPTVNAPCMCHYEGTLIDGTEFDSSYKRGEPTSFAPNQVIKGWTEAMQLMVEGDKFELYIPSDLGYGDRGSPPKIGGGDVLIFRMEMISINGDKVPAIPPCNVETLENCDDKEKTFIGKMKEQAKDKVKSDYKRLIGMNLEKTIGKAKTWVLTRIAILKQLLTGENEDL